MVQAQPVLIEGAFDAETGTWSVTRDKAAVTVTRSQGIARHTDSFQWGYIGSGAAQLAIELQVCKQLSARVAWQLTVGDSSGREASVVKLFKTELAQRMSQVGLGVMGLQGQLQRGDARAPLNGRAEKFYRQSVSSTITGGTSEIQRNVIATRGLGLPR